MTQKHKNAEYIIAFANGEEVEWKYDGLDFALDAWKPVPAIAHFDKQGLIFRMKPKTVKTKGYKRYAWQQNNLEWVVGIIHEGDEDDYSNRIYIDKEWQYHVIEDV